MYTGARIHFSVWSVCGLFVPDPPGANCLLSPRANSASGPLPRMSAWLAARAALRCCWMADLWSEYAVRNAGSCLSRAIFTVC